MVRTYFVVSLVLVAMSAFLLGCNDSSTAPALNEDPAPIAAPTNVVAKGTADGILITWDASSHPELRGYNVYRYDRSAGKVSQLNSTVVTENRYVDGTAQWRTHYQYRVTSVSRRSESGPASVDIEYRDGGKKDPRDRQL